jgi:hypothetical protein
MKLMRNRKGHENCNRKDRKIILRISRLQFSALAVTGGTK